MIDTHTHLYDEKFDSETKPMIQRALNAGVTKLYMPNCFSETIDPMLAIEKEFPETCFAMMGLHPCYVKEDYKKELEIVANWFEKRTFSAVGEIGLDYYWDKTFVKEQHEAFCTQMEIAIQYKRPIVIHNREATKDTIDLVRKYLPQGIRGVFHCFTGSLETAKIITDMGFYLGIGGVVTYPKAGLQDVINQIDLRHLVLETDAPYLTPVPYRGKRNESSYLSHIAEKISSIKSIELDEVIRISNENANLLFA
ncbi:MAG: TatD family hydrolase [Chitinophagaceae bacterium]